MERSLAKNSIEAYTADVDKLFQYLQNEDSGKSFLKVDLNDLRDFLAYINKIGVGARTQARIISGIKTFFKYLLLEDLITSDPSELLEAPRLGRKLPITLSISEIDKIEEVIDLSKPEGTRNKAIIGTLYSCGLRVSDSCNWKRR